MLYASTSMQGLTRSSFNLSALDLPIGEICGISSMGRSAELHQLCMQLRASLEPKNDAPPSLADLYKQPAVPLEQRANPNLGSLFSSMLEIGLPKISAAPQSKNNAPMHAFLQKNILSALGLRQVLIDLLCFTSEVEQFFCPNCQTVHLLQSVKNIEQQVHAKLHDQPDAVYLCLLCPFELEGLPPSLSLQQLAEILECERFLLNSELVKLGSQSELGLLWSEKVRDLAYDHAGLKLVLDSFSLAGSSKLASLYQRSKSFGQRSFKIARSLKNSTIEIICDFDLASTCKECSSPLLKIDPILFLKAEPALLCRNCSAKDAQTCPACKASGLCQSLASLPVGSLQLVAALNLSIAELHAVLKKDWQASGNIKQLYLLNSLENALKSGLHDLPLARLQSEISSSERLSLNICQIYLSEVADCLILFAHSLDHIEAASLERFFSYLRELVLLGNAVLVLSSRSEVLSHCTKICFENEYLPAAKTQPMQIANNAAVSTLLLETRLKLKGIWQKTTLKIPLKGLILIRGAPSSGKSISAKACMHSPLLKEYFNPLYFSVADIYNGSSSSIGTLSMLSDKLAGLLCALPQVAAAGLTLRDFSDDKHHMLSSSLNYAGVRLAEFFDLHLHELFRIFSSFAVFAQEFACLKELDLQNLSLRTALCSLSDAQKAKFMLFLACRKLKASKKTKAFCLIFDACFSHLDLEDQARVIKILQDIISEGNVIICCEESALFAEAGIDILEKHKPCNLLSIETRER